jgi:hypothetical protein
MSLRVTSTSRLLITVILVIKKAFPFGCNSHIPSARSLASKVKFGSCDVGVAIKLSVQLKLDGNPFQTLEGLL